MVAPKSSEGMENERQRHISLQGLGTFEKTSVTDTVLTVR